MRLLLLLCVILSSCTNRMGYRQSPELTIETLKHRVSLAHVEIDDQGEMVSFDQLKRVTQKIRKESCEPLLLIVYLHGWNRNSSTSKISGGGDLVKFRETLERFAVVRPEIKTMGVFVSWRGRSLSTFPVGVDYFHRHASALRAGGVAGTEIVHELGATARAANPKSRVIMLGHSMGGAILESAFSEAVAAKIATAHAEGKKVKRRDFPADLIVTVNSAQSAIHARQLVATFKNRGIHEIEGGPLLVSITSQADTATSLAFPLSNILGRWVPPINFFNTNVAGLYRERRPEDDLQGSQAAAHRTTVGHFRPLFSHQVQQGPPATLTFPEILKNNQNACQGEGFTVHGEKAGFTFGRPTSPYYNDTPYWIVPVPAAIMKNHEDIWNDSFLGMLTALMSLSE